MVFVLLFSFLLQLWSAQASAASLSISQARVSQQLLSASQLALLSPGVPREWEENLSNLSMSGLAAEPWVLDPYKVGNFTSLPYAQLKNLTGLRGDFFFYVEDLNGNRLASAGNSSLGANASATFALTRYAVFNKQIVRVWWLGHE